MLLKKGLEVEMYTGTFSGDIVGFSDKIVENLEGFVREPDKRNVEYMTTPCREYEELLCQLIQPRLRLREFLKGQGDYTIIPGSTLSLGDSSQFYPSDPGNPYHEFIEKTYGTKVVTASIHINIGLDDIEVLMRAWRVIRLEASLYLALSASSPFLDRKTTGFHSTRWSSFPKTHAAMPIFASHQDYIDWTHEQLRQGTMQNVRHLWTSARPNGPDRPTDLDRLELRICDLISDPLKILALTALMEARVWQVMEDPSLDPLTNSPHSLEELALIAAKNEDLASEKSLDACLHSWQTGETICARDWLTEIYHQVFPWAQKHGFDKFLRPLCSILENGNEAQIWLKQLEKGENLTEIFSQRIAEMMKEESELNRNHCQEMLPSCADS